MMKIFYEITTWLFFAIGILHAAFAFKKYKSVSEDALWFFSATFGIVFCSLINYLNIFNLSEPSKMISIASNAALFAFFLVLLKKIFKPTIILGAAMIFVLLSLGILFILN